SIHLDYIELLRMTFRYICGMQRIAIFASGTGSNAVKIIEHFKGHPSIEVSLVLSNNSKAEVISKATSANLETFTFNREALYNTNLVLNKLLSTKIDLVVLAGFMWLVPENIVSEFSDRIINIHPALLPKFGGKGMYGMHVHTAVKSAGETESGITIHLVNREYDKGKILHQATCGITEDDTPESIAKKIQKLEHQHFALQIERYLEST
ncbi:MAG: phosphoribosylglycinamide formyltransferase, partial [Flavobacteriales bacterium]